MFRYTEWKIGQVSKWHAVLKPETWQAGRTTRLAVLRTRPEEGEYLIRHALLDVLRALVLMPLGPVG